MSDIDARNYLAITYCEQQKKAWNIGHLDKKRMTCVEQLVSLTCVSSEAYFSPGGVFPYMGYIGTYSTKGYGCLAFLV